MPIKISDSLRQHLPIDVVSQIEQCYNNNPSYFDLPDLRIFSTWCKKHCSIDLLIQYILSNSFFSLEMRRGITSYLLGVHCPTHRMTDVQRATITNIRDRQMKERKEISKKRSIKYVSLEQEAKASKRMKMSIVEAAKKEQCITNDTESLVLSVEMLAHCFEYLDFSKVWELRIVCKLFYNAYRISPFPIIIYSLTNDVLRTTLLRLVHYAMDSIVYSDKKDASEIMTYIYKNYSIVLDMKKQGKDSLNTNRMKSILKKATPIFYALKDRILIHNIPIRLNTCRYPVEIHPFVNSFLLSIFDMSYISGGIIFETLSRYLPPSSNMIELLSRARNISWIKFKCHTEEFITLIQDISMNKYVFVNIKSIIIDHPDTLNFHINPKAITNQLLMLEEKIPQCFPSLNDITFVNPRYELPLKIGDISLLFRAI